MDYIAALEKIGLKVEMFGGSCPAQVHAILPDGNYLYFRARGDAWRLTIASLEDEAVERNLESKNVWSDREGDYGGFEAGYMLEEKIYNRASRVCNAHELKPMQSKFFSCYVQRKNSDVREQ